MWKTFKAELKHIFTNKWRTAALILLLFIPFTYGFLYMNAYWAPFSHVDELKIAVVSRDVDSNGKETKLSSSLSDFLIKDNQITAGPNQVYKITKDQDINKDPESAVSSGKYSAVIVIPKGYDAAMTKFATDTIADPSKIKTNLDTAFKTMGGTKVPQGWKGSFDRVTFYLSFKHSYLGGEMANYASKNTKLVLATTFPQVINAINTGQNLLNGIGTFLGKPLTSKISFDKLLGDKLTVERYGYEHSNSYGMGLAPYFMSIALWAGALATLFVVKNERHIDTETTLKHLAGKALVWMAIGWIQAAILITGLTLQGIRIGWDHQYELYLFGFFMATIFPLTVMGAAYTMRYGDLGEFLVVIMLVAQLISSSGTFPVEMQNIIFKIIHPIAPFTYTISALREIMWDTDLTVLFENMAILLIFPAIFMTATVLVNYLWDRKNFTELDGVKKYKSFEIHLGDY